MKNRRDNKTDRGQRERDNGSARCGAAKTLFFIFSAAEENREPERQLKVNDNKSDDGSFLHRGQAFGKGDTADDQLRGISECGIEQSSQSLPNAAGKRFGGAPDPARNRKDA